MQRRPVVAAVVADHLVHVERLARGSRVEALRLVDHPPQADGSDVGAAPFERVGLALAA